MIQHAELVPDDMDTAWAETRVWKRGSLGRPPKLLGFTLRGDPVPAELATAKWILESAKAGHSCNEIATTLNTKGYKTSHGAKWHQANTERVLLEILALPLYSAVRKAAGVGDPK